MPHTRRTASGVLGGFVGLVGLSAVAGILISATVTPAIAVTGYAASSAITLFDNLPSGLEIDKLMLPSTFYATDPDTGAQIALATYYDQNRVPVQFDEVAPVMFEAILSSEDPRYYQHGGIDLIGTARALLSNLSRSSGETQGGSSISQQYVKNILIQRCERDAVATDDLTEEEVLQNCWFDATTAEGNEGYERKIQEMKYAISLEQKYSKNDILLGYLNISNFGGRTYGIEAAARYYFNTTSANLTLGQAAALAGIVQNPNTYNLDNPTSTYNGAPDGKVDAEKGQLAALDSLLSAGKITQEQYLAAADGYTATKGRQLYVLSRMLDDGKITREQYEAAVVEPIVPQVTAATTGCAAAGGEAYFCQYVKNIIETDPAFGETAPDRERLLKRGGLSVYTTLDYRIQRPAVEAMREWAPTSIDGMVDAVTGRFGSAAVSIDATNGRILAIAQNTAFSEDGAYATDPNYSSLVYAGGQDYGKSNGFEVGSTFKLFTLVDWLEKGHSVNEVINGRLRVIPRLTNTCDGDWVNVNNEKPGNFAGNGYVGTPMQFTRDSLNSGFFAMAEKLDLCDIKNVATKMGVTRGDGTPVVMDGLFSVVGSNNISPIAMAGAYATIANNGVYCKPKAIDRVTDADGNELNLPEAGCTQVVDPKVAATAAYALQGVMSSGGTGSQSNPDDGTPLIGKTGTNEEYQTWMIESSTQVATAVWVGNSNGKGDLFQREFNGVLLSNLRHQIAPRIQAAADAAYGGHAFPERDENLSRQVLTDLPNVVGMPLDQAQKTLEDVGFEVVVGNPMDSPEAAGIVALQDPGAGKVAGGTPVTIYPSNGLGLTVPDVTGRTLAAAVSALRSAGFGNVQNGQCTVDASAGGQQKATGTSPGAGTVVNRNTQIAVNYATANCGPGGGSGGPGGGSGGPGGGPGGNG